MDSVRLQTYRPIELIVIDDGSEDNTQTVVQQWTEKYKDDITFSVRYIYQENRGANAARNKGIAEATGEYVAFLDSDDRWLPDKLTKQMAVFKKDSSVGDVYCGLYHIDMESGVRLDDVQLNYPTGELIRRLLIQDVTTPTSCHVVKKDCFQAVGFFDESLPARQDWDMWIRVASRYKIGCVPEVLVEQREHAGNRVRSNPMNEILAAGQIFHKYASLRRQFPFWINLAARSAMYRRRGRVYYHRGLSIRQAFGLQLLAILVWPFAFDSYAALTGMLLPTELRQRIHVAWNKIFGKTRLAIRSH
jgi:glycosyltransferase involved in cell wall biosynthesis